MRTLPHALAFLTAALLTSGCPKNTGENPPPAESTENSGTLPGSFDMVREGVADSAAKPPAEADSGVKGELANREAVEACMDRWLQGRKLDRYGHPEGTMYAGGTPLFDERTGETTDRLEYVFKRQPEARQACIGAGASKQ